MSNKYKEVKMSKPVAINVSADALWEIIGPGFADAGKWSTAVDHSAGLERVSLMVQYATQGPVISAQKVSKA